MRGQTMSVKKTNLEVCTHACNLRAHCTLHGNIIFDILEQSSFQKYTTCWVFLALCHMLYLCVCVFVYLCICVFLYFRFWHMGISFLTSLNNPLFKNISHGGFFWHFVICCICVFVCLCICVFVFGLGRSLLDQFGQKNASPLSSTFWFESSKPSYLFKSVLLLQPYSIWVDGWAPVSPCKSVFSP